MEIGYIIGLAVSVVLALVGTLYKIMSSTVKENTLNIEALDDKVDSRLDEVEKDIVIIKTKIER